jgi:hypothetical protein
LHGIAKPHVRHAFAAATIAAALVWSHPLRAADAVENGATQTVPPPAWPTSPYHGVISGATGEPIPCRCRYRDSDFRLGDTVCMTTYRGVQLARCDLFLNNTTWVPIGVPCTMSLMPGTSEMASTGQVPTNLVPTNLAGK